MAKPQLHTALWLGEEHTLSVSGWSRLTGRSTLFFWRVLKIAEEKGIPVEKRMQFALDEFKPGSGKRQSKKGTSEVMIAPRFSKNRENIAMAENKKPISSFLYGRSK